MKKPVSLILVLALCLSMFAFTACSKKVESKEFVPCDWYNSSSYEIDIPFDGYRDSYYYSGSCAVNDKAYVALIERGYPSEYVDAYMNGAATGIPDEKRIRYSSLTEIDVTTGEVTNSYNITDMVKDLLPADTNPDFLNVLGLMPDGDNVTIYFTNYGYVNPAATERLECVKFNTKDGTLSNYRVFDNILGNSYVGRVIDSVHKVNDMDLVLISTMGYMGGSYVFVFVKDGAIVGSADLDTFYSQDITRITGFIVDNNQLFAALELGQTRGIKHDAVYIDLDTFIGRVSYDNAAIINNPICSLLGGTDSYSSNAEGIYKYNTQSKNMEMLVDYNFADINIYNARNSSILSVAESRIVMIQIDYASAVFLNGNPKIRLNVLEGSDENPYEGKTALTVADMSDSIDYATSEAIRKFNSTNPDYYINLRVYHDDAHLSGLYALSDVSNRVLIDIANGDAPDVILNGASYKEMNSSTVLLDLSSYVAADSSINDDNFFMNIIEASYINDKLYQIPLSGNLVGVRSLAGGAAGELAGEATGDFCFTCDEYDEFISSCTNGYDPIADYSEYDQAKYTNELVGPQLDKFINYSTNEVDFDNPDFREAVEFINNMAFLDEENRNLDNWVIEPFIRNEDTYYGELSPFLFFRTCQHFGSDIKVCGVGSADMGAEFNILSSAAISAASPNPDGAWQFIQTLMSSDIMSLGSQDSVIVNRKAFNNVMADLKADVDEEIMLFKATNYGFGDDIEMYGLAEITDSAFHNLVSNIESVNTIYSTDAKVMIVITEEIAAFYEGQKSLDDIIGIINDRVKTIVTERN